MKAEVQARKQPLGTRAVEFLELLHPESHWVITAIEPDGPVETRSFSINDQEAAREFIADRISEGANLYYSLNPTRAALSSKAKKGDIAGFTALHVDIDPHDDETSEEFKERMRPVLETFEPEPSVVIDSGNGYQALWFLDKVVPNDGPEAIAEIEERNHALAERLGADPSTRNVDRILRLPGTKNFPNRRKRKLGRTECRTKKIWFYDTRYPLAAFTRKKPDQQKPAPAVESPATVLPPNVEAMLHLKEPGPYKTRSELLFAFLMMARHRGVSDTAIVQQCFDSTFAGCAIHEHVTTQANPRTILAEAIRTGRPEEQKQRQQAE